jgi:hypothetical protein
LAGLTGHGWDFSTDTGGTVVSGGTATATRHELSASLAA